MNQMSIIPKQWPIIGTGLNREKAIIIFWMKNVKIEKPNESYSAREAHTHELSEDQRLNNINQKLLFKGYRYVCFHFALFCSYSWQKALLLCQSANLNKENYAKPP